MNRRLARKKSFFIIFQYGFHDDFNLDEVLEKTLLFDEDDIQDFESSANEQKTFIYEITSGVIQNLNEPTGIDEVIKENCKGWSFDRLNYIDVAILRLAIYEILYRDDIPMSVSINEAVELAKIYGDDNSSSFINGLLGKAFKNKTEQATKKNNGE